MKEALIGAAASIVGAMIGALMTYLQMRQQTADAKRGAVCAYLETISAALKGMTTEFDKGRIPYHQGHLFQGLIKNYESRLRPYLRDGVMKDLEKLREINDRAVDMDGQLGGEYQENEEKRDKLRAKIQDLAADLQRLSGDLEAHAVSIRADIN